MFVRFVTTEIHLDSGQRMGAFQAAYRLIRAETLPVWAHNRLADIIDWFCEHMPAPPHRFFDDPRAICWFRHDADLHITRLAALARRLEEAGAHIERIWTRKPGYVKYEDEIQVVAVPYRDTFRR